MDREGVIFLDSNIPIYAAGRQHPYREPCARIIIAVGAGDLKAVTDAEVVQEISHRDHALRRTNGPTAAEEFLSLMEGDVLPVTEADMARCLTLLRDHPFLSPRDAIHVAVILHAGVERILTTDRRFDQVREIERIDPLEMRW